MSKLDEDKICTQKRYKIASQICLVVSFPYLVNMRRHYAPGKREIERKRSKREREREREVREREKEKEK